MRVTSFADIEAEFIARAHRMVYAALATTGPGGRPRTRVVHTVWDGATGWAVTFPGLPKEMDIRRNPFVSLAYVAEPQAPAYAECTAGFVDDPASKRSVWEFTKNLDAPAGYDPAIMYSGADDPKLLLIRFTPWRIRLSNAGKPDEDRIWQDDAAGGE